MKRIALFLFVVLATHLAGGCAHGTPLRQNAKQSAIYLGVVVGIVALMALSGCEHCTFQESPSGNGQQ